VSQHTHLWGKVDPFIYPIDAGSTEMSDAEDLVDYAAIHNFIKKGKVYALPRAVMPAKSEVALFFDIKETFTMYRSGSLPQKRISRLFR